MSLYVTQTLLDLSNSQMYKIASQVVKLVKNLPAQCRRHKRHGFSPWVRKIPWRRTWQPTPGFLPGKSHGQGSLAGYGSYGLKELRTTEHACTLTGWESCHHVWIENKILSQHEKPTQKVNFSADSSEQVEAADGAFPFGQWLWWSTWTSHSFAQRR